MLMESPSRYLHGLLPFLRSEAPFSLFNSIHTLHVARWQADLKGINEAKNYWQAYFDKYTYEHEVLAGAADKEANVAFCFWLDKVSLHRQQIHHNVIMGFGYHQTMCLCCICGHRPFTSILPV